MKHIMAIVHANELLTLNSERPKAGKEFEDLGLIEDGAVVIQGDQIIDVGPTPEILKKHKPKNVIDAAGKVVMPGFVDSHTHLVYAGSRHAEYEQKISGKSYQELHETGGIHYTVRRTRSASKEELTRRALKDLDIMLLHGTTTVEAKSGYGLDEPNELKILEVIAKLNSQHPIDVVATFLGAHTVADEYKKDKAGYVELVKRMIPKAARLAEFCDVWCDPLGFSEVEAREILEEAIKHGMKLKIHAEQTGHARGAELAAQLKAVSCDHLDFISDEGIAKMKQAGVIAALLPGVTYHLMEFTKEIPVKKMIEGGLPIALATDYNPGTCPTQSMQAILDHASRILRLSYAQALNAATINAAYALDRGSSLGSLQPGKKADIVIYDCQAHGMLINNFGINHVHAVIKNGKVVVENQRIVGR